jgi:hypothetical protein
VLKHADFVRLMALARDRGETVAAVAAATTATAAAAFFGLSSN